ncbi:MAG: pre-mRNA cleavage and polyadenylation factor (CPF) complex subunit [Watsoniomyces obsoletus]|nr:MAG: pre-mRNA cleavage and polyadenylation factor (CPF) complex subunit [Watsoniomyces obsoletus]
MASDEDVHHASRPGDTQNKSPVSSRFRFKNKRRHERDDDDHADPPRKRRRSSASHAAQPHRDHRRSRKRSKRSDNYHHQSKNTADDPSVYQTYVPNVPSSTSDLDPDAAFRESLFDALADDEGAAYWEGVYGQPIHTYSSLRPGPQGELEEMSDEEYATHVRASMYVKTHQHIIEERKRREEEKVRKQHHEEEMLKVDLERIRFYREVEASLKRGEQRRMRNKWRGRWEGYILAWESLTGGVAAVVHNTIPANDAKEGNESKEDVERRKKKMIRKAIPWPIESGKFEDVFIKAAEIKAAEINKDAIENFFRHSVDSKTGMDLLATLKIERVRWHPDKVQQRLAAIKTLGKIEDEETLRSVTAVFQVIDRLWNEEREKRG